MLVDFLDWTVASRCGTAMITTITTGEGNAVVFVVVDHFNAECVGTHFSLVHNS